MSDQRPFSVIREGAIAASLWERSGKKGSYLEFTLSRSYKAGEVFRYSTTFHERDAEVLKRVIDRAAEGIRENCEPETKQGGESARADLDSGADEPPASTDSEADSQEDSQSET